jgi:hypothetical protein
MERGPKQHLLDNETQSGTICSPDFRMLDESFQPHGEALKIAKPGLCFDEGHILVGQHLKRFRAYLYKTVCKGSDTSREGAAVGL